MTLTTERANPLCQWNPDWGGSSTARRPVAAVNVFFLRRSVFVKRFTHEMALREVPAVRRGRPGARQPTELRSRAQPGCATGIDLTAYAATGDCPRTRSHSRSSGAANRRKRAHRMTASTRSLGDAYSAFGNGLTAGDTGSSLALGENDRSIFTAANGQIVMPPSAPDHHRDQTGELGPAGNRRSGACFVNQSVNGTRWNRTGRGRRGAPREPGDPLPPEVTASGRDRPRRLRQAS